MTPPNASMITRCPQCGTAFRITEAQLNLAKGKVRCGSCLTIFKAQENLTDVLESEAEIEPQPKPEPQPPQPKATQATAPKAKTTDTTKASPTKVAAEKPAAPQAKPKAPPKTAAPANKPAAPAKITARSDDPDEMLISDNMDEATQSGAGYENFMQVNLESSATGSLFDRKIKIPDEDELIKDTDESWAETLMEDEEQTPKNDLGPKKETPQSKPKQKKEKREESHSQSKAEDSTRSGHKTPLGTPAVTPTPGLVFNLIGEKQGNEMEYEEPESSESDAFKQAAASFNAEMFEMPEETSETGSKRQVKTHPKIRAYDSERSALLMNIIPAPIEFTVKNIRRYQQRLWPAVSACALVILIIQVAWFKFDYLSRVEPYRTAYVFLCPALGCTVPSLVDTGKIGISHFKLRQDLKNKPDVLLVDFTLLNNAPFEQPFPDLALTFTDINQNHVASRRLTPKEYLTGELVGRTLIPQNQPVHIALELVDPGSEAQNYRLEIAR